jgi:lysyl-tRNA synthetase class 1
MPLPDWVGPLVDEIQNSRPGPYTLATGVSPSGPIHIGNLREVFIADSVARGLRERGERARLIYIADSYDPLRKVYPFLPPSFEAHIGKPLSEIPDPEGCCPSYADHFLRGLDVLEDLEIREGFGEDGRPSDRTVVPLRSDRLYKEGRYSDAIRIALDRREDLARIIREVSTREVPEGWSPFMPICGRCGRLDRTTVAGHDATHADYRCGCGHSGRAPYAGGGKLGWRVDWPARWKLLGVSVEPFGKDIGAAGGSHDTGVRIAREIFDSEPPFPIYFEHILLKGDSGGKLSKSAGRTLTARELLDLMPPAALRALLTRTTPRKSIRFDPGLELMRDLDDPSFLALLGPDPARVPFGHMVTLVQLAPDSAALRQALARSGFGSVEPQAAEAQARRARNWLERWAPEEVKFRLQPALPAAAQGLGLGERRALALLAGRLGTLSGPEALHNGVYAAAGEAGVPPQAVFRAVYRAFLGRESGPRAGWFLSSLDPAFVRRRLEEASR